MKSFGIATECGWGRRPPETVPELLKLVDHVCDELKIPVRYVGVGETVADLRPFSPTEFVEALFQ